MLKLTDFGCNQHNLHQLTFWGIEADLLQEILNNLPHQGDFRTLICDQGNTHLISFQVQAAGATRLRRSSAPKVKGSAAALHLAAL